jgi:hypothetical protein
MNFVRYCLVDSCTIYTGLEAALYPIVVDLAMAAAGNKIYLREIWNKIIGGVEGNGNASIAGNYGKYTG